MIYVDDSDARHLPDEAKWLCGSCAEGPFGNADDPAEELSEMIGSGEWPPGSSLDCDECGAPLAHDA